MPIQIRTGILRLHRWAGLTLALLVAWLALTGAGMLFAPQLRSIVDHDLDVVPVCTDSLPLDSAVAARRPGSARSGLHGLLELPAPTRLDHGAAGKGAWK
jgi:uncharacterized iron-regulated membrane protein